MMTTIGQIYANVAGDMRYGTTIAVRADQTIIEIHLVSSNPIGGMDGDPGLLVDNRPLDSCTRGVFKDDIKWVIRRLRHFFKEADAGTVARYGRPTRRFTWFIDGETKQGFNMNLAAQALESLDREIVHDKALHVLAPVIVLCPLDPPCDQCDPK